MSTPTTAAEVHEDGLTHFGVSSHRDDPAYIRFQAKARAARTQQASA